jgi:hypothetical protein
MAAAVPLILAVLDERVCCTLTPAADGKDTIQHMQHCSLSSNSMLSNTG